MCVRRAQENMEGCAGKVNLTQDVEAFLHGVKVF